MEPDVVFWNGVQCAGCGKDLGTACIAYSGGPPKPPPVFAYVEGDCPVCRQREIQMSGPPDPLNPADPGYVPLSERLARFKAARRAAS